MSRYDEEAVCAYPELRTLIAMREAGWRFSPHFDNAGDVVQLDGFRPGGRCIDVVRVRDRADTVGQRLLASGQVVWEKHGTLSEIVRELLSLPAGGPDLDLVSITPTLG